MDTKVTITTAESRVLSGRLFQPGAPEPDAPAVVVHPATGVHMGLYVKFTEFLAG